MSVLTYNGVRMQIQKTERLGFAPQYTEDGVDYLYTEFDIAVTAIVNPRALASQGPGNIAQGAAQGPFQEDAPAQGQGDSLGVSLVNLRQMLLTPRQNLTFSINQDQVVNISGPDARQGPLPQRDTYIRWIMGTRTALVYFHVKAWAVEFVSSSVSLGTQPHIVLANRYRVTSLMDEDYWTTRQVSGQMIIDTSKLRLYAASGVLTPDNFRASSFLQIPLGFKRDNVKVTVSSDNTTVDYSYTDAETPLALGPRSLATRIEGYTTASITSPLANLEGASALAAAAMSHLSPTLLGGAAGVVAGASFGARVGGGWGGLAGGAIGTAVGGAFGSLFKGADASANLAGVIASGGRLPTVTGVGMVRLWGRREATQQILAALGVNILLDRFSGNYFNAYNSPNSIPRIGSIMVSYDIVDRFAEVQCTFIPTYKAMLTSLNEMQDTALNLMNNDPYVNTMPGDSDISAINQSGGPANTSVMLDPTVDGVNPLPSSAVYVPGEIYPFTVPIFGPGPYGAGTDQTRGDWVGAMVVALLSTPGQGPSLPTDPAVNVNITGMP